MINKAYFIFGSQYARYDATADQVDNGYPKPIASNWPGFSAAGFDTGIDSAFDVDGKVYFFKGNQYLRYDVAGNMVEAGYPLAIGDNWSGLAAADFASGIDAAVNWGNGKAYLFKGAKYMRYDLEQDQADGDPQLIGDGWPGFAAAGFGDAIDTAINWGDGKAYFFRGNQYLRYDIAADSVDPGFPQSIDDNWPGLAAARQGSTIQASWARTGSPGVGGGTDFSHLSDAFFTELKNVCSRLACAPEDLLGVMKSESDVRPWAQNPNGHATGLIQFMPATLQGLGWTQGPDAFKDLTAEQQLPYVEKYYAPHIGWLTSAGRLYQATFLPATLPNTDEASVIAAPGGPHADAYNANRLLDTNNDGAITVSDLTARINNVRQGASWQALLQRL